MVDGIRIMRVGSLLGLMAWTLALVEDLYFTFFFDPLTTPNWVEDLIGPLTRLIGTVVLVLIVIYLFNFYEGASHLTRFDSRMNIGRMGVLLMISGVLVSFLGSWIVIMVMNAAEGSGQEGVPPALALSMNGVVIVGSGLMIVGSLLFAIMMVRLSKNGLGWGYGVGGFLYLAMEVLRALTTFGLLRGILTVDTTSILERALGLASMLLIYWTSTGFLKGFHPEEKVPVEEAEPVIQ